MKKNIDILLIDPKINKLRDEPLFPRLGICYLTAYLMKYNYNIQTIVLGNYNSKEKLISVLKKINPRLIGISCLTPEIPYVYKIAQITKEALNVPVIAGGTHPSFAAKDILKNCKNVDIVVKNEGEITLKELLDHFIRKKSKSLREIHGLIFRENGHIVETENRALINNLDDLPFPLRNYSVDFQTIMCSRGCIFNCRYCLWCKIHGRKMRYRSVKNVTDEIDSILNKNPNTEFYFIDSALNINDDYLKNLCEVISSRKIRRVQMYFCIKNMNSNLIKSIKKAHIIVFIGVESGSKKIRESLNKNFQNSDVLDFCDKLRKTGISVCAGFMLGLPGENKQSLLQTFNLIHELLRRRVIIALFSFMPFPGTDIWNNRNYDYEIIDRDFRHWTDDYVCIRTSELSAEELASYAWSLRIIHTLRMQWRSYPLKILSNIINFFPYFFWERLFHINAFYHRIVNRIFTLPKNRITLRKSKKFYYSTIDDMCFLDRISTKF